MFKVFGPSMGTEKSTHPVKFCKISLGRRHVQYSLLFFGGLIAYAIRASLSVAIVAMVSDHPPDPDIKTYPNWTNKDVILSSFFWGYALLQVPAGFICYKYGPKYFLGVSFSVASVLTVLAPLMAEKMGSSGIMINRIIQGLSQGFLYPSTHSIMSKWTPLPERSRAISFVYSGGVLGPTIGMPIAGVICGSRYGWPMVFYSFGTIGLLWSFTFLWLCHNSPQEDPGISEVEQKYLKQQVHGDSGGKRLPVPWRSLFTSIHFWAIVIANSGNSFGFLTLLAEIPSFMEGVLKFNIEQNSFLSALPFLASFVIALSLSPISDSLIARKKLSIKASRKIFNCLGTYIPAVALIILSFINPEMKSLAVLLLVIAVGFNAAILVGFNANHIDIAPNFAGILVGFSNGAGQVAAIIGPLLVQVIVTDQSDPAQWRIVFIIAASVFISTSTFFLIFASGDIQRWNGGGESTTPKGIALTSYKYVQSYEHGCRE
ncbi:hypothetical protein WA026_000250 [Henosepilachna vigintioctopunctata]|uniref:Putative inorganic phosphate cotransporter n=1 Tax=Henosepilachna vigintioctopunctata TaxID=420089 RepID=A0AAW1UX00_9CUCU